MPCAVPAAFAGCAGDIAAHATLPVLALSAAQPPAFFLLMRAAMLGELRQRSRAGRGHDRPPARCSARDSVRCSAAPS